MTLTIVRPRKTALPVEPELVRLRRWTRLLVAALGLLTTILVALAVALLGRSEVQTELPTSVAKSPSEVASRTPVVPLAVVSPRTPSDGVYLEALGSTSAAQLYQSYIGIGLIADAVETEAYGRPEGDKLLASLLETMSLLDRQLARVGALELGAADRASLEHIQAINGLLRRQADRLRRYWSTQQPEHAAAYHEARAAAWRDIERLLRRH
jgi:hypothetical protein